MHHVAGDLMAPECLFQPLILKTFSLILESDLDIKECWEDLMEYIMNRFVRAAQKSPAACIRKMFHEEVRPKLETMDNKSHVFRERSESTCTIPIDLSKPRSNCDRLYWLYLQFEQTADPIGFIIDALTDELHQKIERKDVLQQLLTKDIINENEYKHLALTQLENCEKKVELTKCSQEEPSSTIIKAPQEDDYQTEINHLVKRLTRLGFKQQICWIQELILNVSIIKSPHGDRFSSVSYFYNCEYFCC